MCIITQQLLGPMHLKYVLVVLITPFCKFIEGELRSKHEEESPHKDKKRIAWVTFEDRPRCWGHTMIRFYANFL